VVFYVDPAVVATMTTNTMNPSAVLHLLSRPPTRTQAARASDIDQQQGKSLREVSARILSQFCRELIVYE